jgi:hypothetical protein
MSGINRLQSELNKLLGLNEWGQRIIIPGSMDDELIETNQQFGVGTIPASKIKNLSVDTITVSSTGYIRLGKQSFTDSTNAGYYFSADGIYIGSASDASRLKYDVSAGTFDFIGTISNRSTATIAGSINSSGNFIKDLINSKLDTSSKKILSDFDFGSTDYAGAVKAGDLAWDSSGVITSGSGVAVYRGGIVGAKNGNTTFSIDTDGDATFSGTITGSTIIGGTIKTSDTTYPNVLIDSNGLTIYGDKLYIKSDTGIAGGRMSVNSDRFEIRSETNRSLWLYAYNDLNIRTTNDGTILGYNSGTGNVILKSASSEMMIDSYGVLNVYSVTDDINIDADGVVKLVSGDDLIDMSANTIRLRSSRTPASSSATGNAGDICWNSNFIYVCVATNTWKKVGISTW